jgi:hypothetical protein
LWLWLWLWLWLCAQHPAPHDLRCAHRTSHARAPTRAALCDHTHPDVSSEQQNGMGSKLLWRHCTLARWGWFEGKRVSTSRVSPPGTTLSCANAPRSHQQLELVVIQPEWALGLKVELMRCVALRCPVVLTHQAPY